MRELSCMEIDEVSGAGWEQSAGALALIGAIGSSTFGGGGVAWGAVAVTAAVGTAPLAVVAIGGLALYAGLCMWFD